MTNRHPCNFLAGASVLLMVASYLAADPLESLIDNEKKAREEWTEEIDELPPAYLWGDQNGVELYSSSNPEDKQNLICQPLPFDELIELSLGNPADHETILNVDLPRVRELLQTACLVRPGDSLVAIAAGDQKLIRIKQFILKRDQAICPQTSPYSLWGTLEEPLVEAPLFYTTVLTMPEGNNSYLKWVEQKPLDQENDIRKKLTAKVVDQSEYRLTIIDIHSSDLERLLILRRSTADINDDGLPNEIILAQTTADIEKVWIERVDLKRGTGHLRVESTFDYNADGFRELQISGEHQGCPYQMVFEGSKEGFRPIDLPLKTCICL